MGNDDNLTSIPMPSISMISIPRQNYQSHFAQFLSTTKRAQEHNGVLGSENRFRHSETDLEVEQAEKKKNTRMPSKNEIKCGLPNLVPHTETGNGVERL
jgi:hypothetical protein